MLKYRRERPACAEASETLPHSGDARAYISEHSLARQVYNPHFVR